jgi:Protein of unknown function (DUF1161)
MSCLQGFTLLTSIRGRPSSPAMSSIQYGSTLTIEPAEMKLPHACLLISMAVSASAQATPCEDVKTAIAAKLDAKHLVNYTLDVVPSEKVGDSKVVGSCEAGAKKIVYTRK